MKRSSLLVTVATLAFIGGLSVRWLISAPEGLSGKSTFKPLPEIILNDTAGRQHNIKEWQGKVLVLNFWATWCPPCLKEMPVFQAMQNEYSQQGLQFIGIAIDETGPVKTFLAQNQISYPVLLAQDEGAKIAHELGNVFNTVPFTVVVNRQGQVVKSHMGELDREDLLEIVKPLF